MSDKVANEVRAKLIEAGLPGALLPSTISTFTFDEVSGWFTVQLSGKTVLSPGGHTVTYQPTIRGRLTERVLDSLDGVTVKIGFFHPAITRIEANASRTTVTFTVMATTHDVAFSAFS
jgi:hypothetical protein